MSIAAVTERNASAVLNRAAAPCGTAADLGPGAASRGKAATFGPESVPRGTAAASGPGAVPRDTLATFGAGSVPCCTTAIRGTSVAPRAQHHEAIAARLARHAIGSLYDELALYPKPGLVSLHDSGSHEDMDATTFMRSLFALRGYFRAVAEAGARAAPFVELRELGRNAERRMEAATGGVNTHRGAIFSLGLLCAGAAALLARRSSVSDEALRAALAPWQRGLTQAGAARSERAPTHGELSALRFGASGARGEAHASFPSIFEVALPALRWALAHGADDDAARMHALFSLLAVVEDTNVLYRGGPAALAFIRDGAGAFVANGSVFRVGWQTDAERLHRQCCERRLSPGGCADLLSATCFVHRVQAL